MSRVSRAAAARPWRVVYIQRRFESDDYIVKFDDGMRMALDPRRYMLEPAVGAATLVKLATQERTRIEHHARLVRFGDAWMDAYEREWASCREERVCRA